ncbi:MAG: hypothetical protein GQ529_04020 [Methyloprofundus sp.]|nr:hypothetical protein [Methyloprofundus sp.]
MALDFGFTVVLGKQAHSRLRNCFSSAALGTKDKSDSGIIEFSFLIRVPYKTASRFCIYRRHASTQSGLLAKGPLSLSTV